MADPRFFQRKGPFSLAEIAAAIEAEIADDTFAAKSIHDIATLEMAGPGEISLFYDARYRDSLTVTRASAIITSRDLARLVPTDFIVLAAKDPRRAFAKLGYIFYPPPPLTPGIDPGARIDPNAKIGEGTQIDAGVVIGRGVEIAENCHIAANAVIGDGVVIGPDCRIGANASIGYSIIGARVFIGAGAGIGGPGFGFIPGPKGLFRMLQLGRVIIEDDVEIGVNSTIDRGAAEDTVIGMGTVIDNLVQIGHNCQLGRYCVVCGQAGIAGSCAIGDGVMIGGQAGIADHLRIGDRARLAAGSGVIRDIEPGATVGGYPAVPIGQWHRQNIGLGRVRARPRSERSDGPSSTT